MECLYLTQASSDFSLIFPNKNTSELKMLNIPETPTNCQSFLTLPEITENILHSQTHFYF